MKQKKPKAESKTEPKYVLSESELTNILIDYKKSIIKGFLAPEHRVEEIAVCFNGVSDFVIDTIQAKGRGKATKIFMEIINETTTN